jgi:ABC-2 type transport system ATP-binding protein
VSFDIAPGETYGLLGPNGAGKTTTISMIAGILRPDAGRVTVAGTT